MARVRYVKARPVAQEYQPDPLHRKYTYSSSAYPSVESENRPSVEADKLTLSLPKRIKNKIKKKTKYLKPIFIHTPIYLYKASTYRGLIRGPSRMGVPLVCSGCNSRLFWPEYEGVFTLWNLSLQWLFCFCFLFLF